jgi:hypothetical protein
MRYLAISFAVVLTYTCFLVSGCTCYEKSPVAGYDDYDGHWIGDGSYNRTTRYPPPRRFVGDGSYNPPPERFIGDGFIGDGSYKDIKK